MSIAQGLSLCSVVFTLLSFSTSGGNALDPPKPPFNPPSPSTVIFGNKKQNQTTTGESNSDGGDFIGGDSTGSNSSAGTSGRSTFDPKITLNGTKLVDIAIGALRKVLTDIGLNSIPLPPISVILMDHSLILTNGSINGLANFEQSGPTLVTFGLTAARVRFAISWLNITIETDLKLLLRDLAAPNGHLVATVDNVTTLVVLKVEYITQQPSLEEFEVSIGNINVTATGLGNEAKNGTEFGTKIGNALKPVVLLVFNIGLKALINSALVAARAAATG